MSTKVNTAPIITDSQDATSLSKTLKQTKAQRQSSVLATPATSLQESENGHHALIAASQHGSFLSTLVKQTKAQRQSSVLATPATSLQASENSHRVLIAPSRDAHGRFLSKTLKPTKA